MFKVTTDKQKLFKKYKDYYRTTNCDSVNNLINRLSGNGVIMNLYGFARYFELGVSEAMDVIKELNIEPVIAGAVPYYFRGDVWEYIPRIEKKLKTLYPENERTKHKDIVDALDVSFYYGISSTVIRRTLSGFKLRKVKLTRASSIFYYYSDILKIKEEKAFKAAIAKSRMPISVDDFDKISSYIATKKPKQMDEIVFRDMNCSKYLRCLDLAASTSDYMDCTKCLVYQLKTDTVESTSFDPSLVFLPKVDQKKIRSLRKVKHFPNVIENKI